MATVRDLVRAAVRAAEEKKAKDVMAIDIRGLSAVTDYMVIATGSSDTNVRAIAEGVREKLVEKGERAFSVEGLQEGSWVLLDYVDFVVHVFHQEKRLFFGLEELWADAKPVPVAATASRRRTERPGAKPAARTAAKEPGARSPGAALKPSKKRSAVPKKTAAPKKGGTAKNATAPKKATRTARTSTPKPKKTPVPKRATKG